MGPHVIGSVEDPEARYPMEDFYFQQDVEADKEDVATHLFQQSVTLTATMWHGGNDTQAGSAGGWRWGSWRVPAEHAPLLVGLCCGVAVVLLALSAAIVWRCCVLPKRKKDLCDGFAEVTSQSAQSLVLPRETAVYALRNGQWGYHSRLVDTMGFPVTRSVTMASMPIHNCSVHDMAVPRKPCRPTSQSIPKEMTLSGQLCTMSQFQVPQSQDSITTHYLVGGTQEDEDIGGRERSKSTPALEDLYAKVNFSKKRRNRMRKDEAAIIALSKSRSGHDKESLAIAGTAVIVYNERTAL